ncbi:hypothetical protein EV2_040088 [Malus domestica]
MVGVHGNDTSRKVATKGTTQHKLAAVFCTTPHGKSDVLERAPSGKGKQQGYQHQLRHFGHHAPINEETSMTAVKRLAGHEACHLTFCLKDTAQ